MDGVDFNARVFRGYVLRSLLRSNGGAIMTKRNSDDYKHAGQVEAFEFMATQFRVYADDNDEVNRRYGIKGKALEIAKKRSQTWRDAAEDCDHYANETKKKMER